MSEPKAPLIDPKDLATLASGVVLGVLIMVFFYFLSVAMDQATFVDHSAIPYQ